MRSLKFMIALSVGWVCQTVATEKETAKMTLEAACQTGRSLSRFLKESAAASHAMSEVPAADVSNDRNLIEPILRRNGLGSHGVDRIEGSLRIDELNSDWLTGDDVE